jgi:hypothetical protein
MKRPLRSEALTDFARVVLLFWAGPQPLGKYPIQPRAATGTKATL